MGIVAWYGFARPTPELDVGSELRPIWGKPSVTEVPELDYHGTLCCFLLL